MRAHINHWRDQDQERLSFHRSNQLYFHGRRFVPRCLPTSAKFRISDPVELAGHLTGTSRRTLPVGYT